MRFKTLLASVAALAWMLLAQPAFGATVSMVSDFKVVYEAALGEINDVSLVEAPEGVFMITDLNAAITPLTQACMSISPNAVRCDFRAEDAIDLRVFVKDGADSVDVGNAFARVYGGAGPDTLSASHGALLYGERGDDRLIGRAGEQGLLGGPGTDSLEGGAGRDWLAGGLGTDVIAGGSEADMVSYFRVSAPVRISLDGLANDGAAGENDWVQADVEDAEGGTGPTTFIGNAGPNRLFGSSSEGDVFRARGGSDFIGCGNGPDVVSAGSGDDFVSCQGGRDVISGGPGDDELQGGARADLIRGGGGRDWLFGGPRNDVLVGGPGRDRLRG